MEKTSGGAPPGELTVLGVPFSNMTSEPSASISPVAAATPGTLPTRTQHRVGERLGEAVVGVADGAQLDDDVVLDVDRVEDLAERAVDLAGHDERARDHRDAEHDRECRQQGAQRARAQARERQAEHRALLQRLDLIEDLVGAHGAAVRDDQPVAQEHHAVGDRGGARVVRDDHDRLAELGRSTGA